MTHIIIFLCCILAGFLVGLYFKRRICTANVFLNDLVRYASALKINVTGRQTEMRTFNEEFVKSCTQPFCDYIAFGKLPALSKMQKTAVEGFFLQLDCASSEALLAHLDFSQTCLKQCLDASDEQGKKASLFVKLGLLCGAMVGILFL